MNKTTFALGAIAAMAISGCVEDSGSMDAPAAGTPAVGSASDLSSFEGARAGQAEGGIRALGYEAIRSDGLTTYWFNRETGACASVTTSDGRYSDVTMLPAEDC
ncbi:hypothetical protein SAMN04488105_1351 [Salipiger thiooxidans]|uniref:Uncharacterized protein n=1 Tax=Salipiger thiooxidans TaxID=282683 RepID=A0A1G7MI83_9RHOB|nr:hypothetical protein [Salipiger thiooxidans]SDF60859.1 hypothetical protein SAMN04488105_1351 [Salipiger thiooxidans]